MTEDKSPWNIAFWCVAIGVFLFIFFAALMGEAKAKCQTVNQIYTIDNAGAKGAGAVIKNSMFFSIKDSEDKLTAIELYYPKVNVTKWLGHRFVKGCWFRHRWLRFEDIKKAMDKGQIIHEVDYEFIIGRAI